MTQYTKGRRAEYRIIHMLERVGYVCVRAAGSKGMVDIVAIGPHDIKLITAKRGVGRLSPLEREALLGVRRPSCASIEYWRLPHRAPPIIEVL